MNNKKKMDNEGLTAKPLTAAIVGFLQVANRFQLVKKSPDITCEHSRSCISLISAPANKYDKKYFLNILHVLDIKFAY